MSEVLSILEKWQKQKQNKKPVCLTTKDNYRSQDLAHQQTMQSYIKLEKSLAFQVKVHKQTDLNHSTTFKKVLGLSLKPFHASHQTVYLPDLFVRE